MQLWPKMKILDDLQYKRSSRFYARTSKVDFLQQFFPNLQIM